MVARGSVTIKQLHANTGERVRQAGRSRTPTPVTDRGKVVAVLIAPELLPAKQRERTLLPEYAELLAQAGSGDVLKDLDTVRGNR
jgi:hypothetical protein